MNDGICEYDENVYLANGGVVVVECWRSGELDGKWFLGVSNNRDPSNVKDLIDITNLINSGAIIFPHAMDSTSEHIHIWHAVREEKLDKKSRS